MKIFLTLTLCSVAMFVVVLRMRPDLVNMDLSNFSSKKASEPAAEPPKAPEKKKIRVQAPAANTPRRVEDRSYASLPSPELKSQPESNRQPDRVPPSLGTVRFAKATVVSDSVAVYATNSLDSRILRMLKKGDPIETSVAVLDREGIWSLVRLPEQRISGYVLSENLIKPTLQTGKPVIP